MTKMCKYAGGDVSLMQWGRITWQATMATLFALVLALVTIVSPAAVSAQATDMGTLVVSSRAEVRVEPDMAVFTVGVETRWETVEEARAANATAMAEIRERLLAAGALERHLKTLQFPGQSRVALQSERRQPDPHRLRCEPFSGSDRHRLGRAWRLARRGYSSGRQSSVGTDVRFEQPGGAGSAGAG